MYDTLTNNEEDYYLLLLLALPLLVRINTEDTLDTTRNLCLEYKPTSLNLELLVFETPLEDRGNAILCFGEFLLSDCKKNSTNLVSLWALRVLPMIGMCHEHLYLVESQM